jgi:hypothetical protein
VETREFCTPQSDCRDTIQTEEWISIKILVKNAATGNTISINLYSTDAVGANIDPWRATSKEVAVWRIGSKSRSGVEPAREQRAFRPLVEGRTQSAECILDGWILGEVALFAGVVGEMIQLFADFNFEAQVGPL